LSVNYAPNSTPSFFKGNENVPTEVDLSISLIEIEYWTKNDFNSDISAGSTGGYIRITGGYIPGAG